MVKRAAEIEDRRIVAKRVFDALCAAYSDKYIALYSATRGGRPAARPPDVTAYARQKSLNRVGDSSSAPRRVRGIGMG